MEKARPDKKPKRLKLWERIKKFCIAGIATIGLLSFIGLPAYAAGVNSSRVAEKVQTISEEDEIVGGRKAQGKREKYAVIFNSDFNTDLWPRYPAFYNGVTLAFDTLRRNGVSEEKIVVLNGDGKNKNPYIKIVDCAATYKNLQKVTQDIAQKIDGNDLFFMYVTNHGRRVYTPFMYLTHYGWKRHFKGESIISLHYGEKKGIPESDLEEMLSEIFKNARCSISIMDQCASGGYVERLGKGKVIAISSCGKEEFNYTFWSHSPFSSSFFNALKDPVDRAIYSKDPSSQNAGTKADSNRDGKVSIREAFDYAVKNDPFAQGLCGAQKQTPQLRYGQIDPAKTFLFDD